MKDVLYCGVALIFFALMIAYGFACRELGRDSDATSGAR